MTHAIALAIYPSWGRRSRSEVPMVTVPPRPCASAKVMTCLFASSFAVGTWLATVNWSGLATTLVGMGSTLTIGFLAVRKMIRDDQKKWELENKDSLMGQLEASNAKSDALTAKLTELTESVATERKSIHAERDEAAKRHYDMMEENVELRTQLRDTSRQLVDTSRQLSEANQKIGDLTAEVERLRLRQEVRNERVDHTMKVVADQVIENKKTLDTVAGKVTEHSENIAQLTTQSGEFTPVKPPTGTGDA